MRPRDYLLDRLPLLLAFAAALGVLLLVVHLAYRPLQLGDVAYIALLAVVATAAILAVDHQRHRQFRREVAERLAARPTNLDRLIAPLPRAASRELRAMTALLDATSAQAAAELQRHRSDAEQHRVFVDQWVHQMKTPVAVLELTARQQQVTAGGSTGPADTAARQANTAAWRSVAEETDALANGLDLMLSTARLERFELDLRPELVDLGAAARAAVNDLKRAWIRAGVYPKIDAPDTVVRAETDPKWLQVVLRQLLTNAIKYSGDGATVTVTVTHHGEGGVISVADTGIGIPPEDVPRVFERFYTGANGRRATASTGMGLYLAAEICRRLGHELDLESTVGRGTTVRVSIAPRAMHVLRDAPQNPADRDHDPASRPHETDRPRQGDDNVRFDGDA